MFLYYLESGSCASDNDGCVLASKREYSQEEFEKIYLIHKATDRRGGNSIWGFASYLIENFEFFYPDYRAGIDLEKFKVQ